MLYTCAGQPAAAVPKHPIESVGNALALLALFKDRRAIRVQEASERLGVGRSTAHRLLAMLDHFGFVERDQTARTYHVGPALVAIAHAISGVEDLLDLASPCAGRSAAALGSPVELWVLAGRDAVFIGSIAPSAAVSRQRRGPASLPAHVAAPGKALLAELSAAELAARYPRERLPASPWAGPKTRSALMAELGRVRARGYAGSVADGDVAARTIACALSHPGAELPPLSLACTLSAESARREGAVEHLRTAACAVAAAVPRKGVS